MSQKKALYLAKSFDELQKLGDVKSKNLKNGSQLFNSMAKLYKNAEEAILEGDEERSYIYFMRFFNLLGFVKKTSEFRSQIEQITSLLGGNSGLNRTFDQLENIAASLRQRYDEQYPPESTPEVVEEEAAAPVETPTVTVPTAVSCKQFYEHIKDRKFSLLIMDCRPRKDFEASKIKYEFMFNVPEEILVKGVSVSKIESALSDENKLKWTSRLYKSHIILLDQSSCEFVSDSPVWVLKDILQNWDMNFDNKAPVQLLSGGFESLQTYYPTEVTDPRYYPMPETSESDLFDNIQYPDSIFQSSMSPAISKTPTVNRASKATAVQTYAEKEKLLQEVLKKHEKVLNESVDIETERLRAEEDWKAITEQDVENRDISRGQEVLHKIYELESKARDMENEDEKLKDFEKKIVETSSKPEAEKLEEQVRRREEEAKAKEQKKRELEENMKRLAEAREKKIKENITPKQVIPKPPTERPPTPKVTEKQPFIPDRKAKPHLPQIYIPERKRDFSPVRGGMGRGLTGLKNLGNTCYMNSIIQCLSNTVALSEYFIGGMYIKHRNGYSMTQCRIAEEVAAVIKALWEGHRIISSKDLKAIVGQYERSFKGHEQQDSHEFLTILMDWLHSDLQAIFSNIPENNLTASDKAWYEFTKQRESIILRLFYGQIKSTVQCSRCQNESITFDTFSNLSLELPQNANRTDLHHCLNMYFNGEQVSGWQCPNCKDTRDAVKKLDISRLPAVLVIHLKRFNVNCEYGGYSKKQNYVEFPLNGLDMRPYLARSEMINKVNTKTTYSLYAVSNHYGTMETGHYTAYCKSPVYDKWYKFNDQQVTSMDPNDVNSSAAYILFYEMHHNSVIR